MRKIAFLLLAMLLASPQLLLADTKEGGRASCSSELTPEDLAAYQANLDAGLYEYDASRTQATYLVNLAFHIVRTTAGTGGIPQSQLDQAMLDAAAAYAGTGICFQVVSQDTINNSTYYSIDNDAERSALKAINNNAHAIDCYFVSNDGGYCGVSSFTWSADQAITFDMGCVGLASNPSTFPHEIGHYFDLLHTHETANGTECPNGSNCATAGDAVCDTPADPTLGDSNVSASCVYTGSETIFCSGAWRSYNPDPDNFMSYSRKTCRTEFTAGQRSRILATLTGGRWGECAFNAPDFDAPTPAGWTDSVVPRNTTGATSGSCLVTSTLPGNSAGTYLNAATRQANGSASFPFIHNRLYLDNQYVWWYSYGSGTNWSGTLHYNNFGPFNVRGGRHSFHASLDWADEVCETSETDNVDYTQWAWSPYALSPASSVQRDTPPEKMTNVYTYPNCDGFQFTGSSWWSAVAIQPVNTTADYDVNLHQGYTGSTTGFEATLASSTYGSGSPDWVLVNHNVAGYGGTYEAGVVNYDGESADYRVNRVASRSITKVDGTRICGELAANQILDVFEFYVGAADLANSWTLSLTSDQTTDLDLYLYPSTLDKGRRSSYVSSSQVAGTPDESLTYTFPAAGWYGVVVGKHGSADLGGSCAYDVKFTCNAPHLTIQPGVAPTVLLAQDNDPWGGSEWRDQLTAQGIAYSTATTADLSTLNLTGYGLVIVPAPTSITSWNNVQAALPALDTYNQSGGVLVLSTCQAGSSADGAAIFDGIVQDYASCNVAHPVSHPLMWGVGADAPGSSAVHYVYGSVPAGYSTLATSDCDGLPAMLFNESRGLVLIGAPIEHSEANYYCSLGESIENIVAWGWKRARQTVRASGTPVSPTQTRVLRYYNGDVAAITPHTTTESASWLAVSPASGNIAAGGYSSIGHYFYPNTLSAGVYSTTTSVATGLYNTPETVYAYLTVGTRTPLAPINLVLTPVDFSPGMALVHLSFDPVTMAVDGQPVVVDHYLLYYDNEWPLQDPAGAYLGTTTSLDLYFHNVGMLEQAFMRVVAVDADGMLLADSHPGEPLPQAAGRSPEGFAVPRAVAPATR